MNKTYIANENHPFLKDGLRLETVPNHGWCVFTGDTVHKLDWADTPSNKPDWYYEVKEEKTTEELYKELYDLHAKHYQEQAKAYKRIELIRKARGE